MNAPQLRATARGGGVRARRVGRVLWTALRRFRGRALGAAALLVGSRLAFVATPWLLGAIIDTLSRPQQVLVLPAFLLLAYAVLRFGGAPLGELRDIAVACVTLASVSDLTLQTFAQLLQIGPRFHTQKQTGGLIRDVELGARGIGYLLGVALFSITPTLVEICAVPAVMVAGYSIVFGLIIAAKATPAHGGVARARSRASHSGRSAARRHRAERLCALGRPQPLLPVRVSAPPEQAGQSTGTGRSTDRSDGASPRGLRGRERRHCVICRPSRPSGRNRGQE